MIPEDQKKYDYTMMKYGAYNKSDYVTITQFKTNEVVQLQKDVVKVTVI